MPRPEIYAALRREDGRNVPHRMIVANHLLVIELPDLHVSDMTDHDATRLGEQVAEVLRFQRDQWKERRSKNSS